MMHKGYRSKWGDYFACTAKTGWYTDDWSQVTCPDCLKYRPKQVVIFI